MHTITNKQLHTLSGLILAMNEVTGGDVEAVRERNRLHQDAQNIIIHVTDPADERAREVARRLGVENVKAGA